jgi:hypothetical protein
VILLRRRITVQNAFTAKKVIWPRNYTAGNVSTKNVTAKKAITENCRELLRKFLPRK